MARAESVRRSTSTASSTSSTSPVMAKARRDGTVAPESSK
jgi:hypothetical protein